ncbi:hypothetical protein [Marinimicrobium sp. ABcell2]|uniref:hypothetical protein n=1 Tax=Marinimicrobium sp. ABcell2 TaxID=3069751 RepID=UPI0027B1DD60|nr:hypothetical protein [Marinimicrobium sp. ABcell2]MDQ2077403.1 hypothetical protein [Marinimicrobium sp. ABcell2]
MMFKVSIIVLLALLGAVLVLEHRMRERISKNDGVARQLRAALMKSAIERLRQNYIRYAYAQAVKDSGDHTVEVQQIEQQIRADEATLKELLGGDQPSNALEPIRAIAEQEQKRISL